MAPTCPNGPKTFELGNGLITMVWITVNGTGKIKHRVLKRRSARVLKQNALYWKRFRGRHDYWTRKVSYDAEQDRQKDGN